MVNSLVSQAPKNDGSAKPRAQGSAQRGGTEDANSTTPPAPGRQTRESQPNAQPDRRHEFDMRLLSSWPAPVPSRLGQGPIAGATNWDAILGIIRNLQSYIGEDDIAVDGAEDMDPGHEAPEHEGALDLEEPDDMNRSGTGDGSASQPQTTHGPFELAEPNGVFAILVPPTGNPLTDPPALTLPRPLNNANPYLPRELASVVAMLPSRSDCDRLMMVYTQMNSMTGPFLHMGQFQRAYSRFWETGNPAAAHATSPLLWMSMLASVLTVGALTSGGRRLAWKNDKEEPEGGKQRLTGTGQQQRRQRNNGMTSGREGNTPETGFDNSDLALGARMRQLSTHCLIAGNYLSGMPLALEALMLNTQMWLMQKGESDPTMWATFAVVVRLAQHLGYHQVDAPGAGVSEKGGRPLTAFEKEMRRRVWCYVEALDMAYSFQYGMPSVIHEDETATNPPSNLHDDDFHEASAMLPPSRPLTDFSPILYFAIKLGFVRLLRRVFRLTIWRMAPAAPGASWAETARCISGTASDKRKAALELYEELRSAYDAIPPQMRMPTHIRDCPFSDNSQSIMRRLVVEMIYHKTVCFLFRWSLRRSAEAEAEVANITGTSREHAADELARQRQACLVSALRILDLHTEFEYESRPPPTTTATTTATTTTAGGSGSSGGGRYSGVGRLAADRFVINKLPMSDFLLAATILCLDLIERSEERRAAQMSGGSGRGSGGGGGGAFTGSKCAPSGSGTVSFAEAVGNSGGERSLEERAVDCGAKLEALRTAYALWHEQRHASREAAHAARILGSIVTKLSREYGDETGDAAKDKDSTNTNTPGSELDNFSWDLAVPSSLRFPQPMRWEHSEKQAATAAAAAIIASGNKATAPTAPSIGAVSSGGLPPEPAPNVDCMHGPEEPEPFYAVLDNPLNVDWNMVDSFLQDRQLAPDVGSNIWSADLMALEN